MCPQCSSATDVEKYPLTDTFYVCSLSLYVCVCVRARACVWISSVCEVLLVLQVCPHYKHFGDQRHWKRPATSNHVSSHTDTVHSFHPNSSGPSLSWRPCDRSPALVRAAGVMGSIIILVLIYSIFIWTSLISCDYYNVTSLHSAGNI